MRVAVIGAGGVGGYIAQRLAAAGAEVAVLARGAHLAAIRAQGLTLAGPAGAATARPAAASDRGAELGAADLAIFAVKGQDMAGAIAEARPVLGEAGVAVSLLNGVDGPEALAAAFGRDRALMGTARISAFIEAPGRIRQVTEFARFTIGDMDGRQDRPPVPAIRAFLAAHGVESPDCADVRAELWRKFAGLSALSAATAGAGADLGTVLATPALAALLERLVAETLAVARAEGVDLGPDALSELVGAHHALPPEMRASLAHDLEAGKPLEIDWLSGAVARIGAARGVPTPAHATVAALLAPHRDGPGRRVPEP